MAKNQNAMPGSLERMVRPCVTHHHACDCREASVKALLREVMRWHSDPQAPEYNECDKDPCAWCTEAAMLIGPNAPGEPRRKENDV